jgi:hypothetical protein
MDIGPGYGVEMIDPKGTRPGVKSVRPEEE